ncbi:MAG: response regulator [Elusimicrobiota bacterium]
MAKAIILVCDDSEETRELLKYSLEVAGYEIILAKDGAEGLKLTQEHLPDLLILDVMMPKEDGFTVNLKLKENEKTKNIPVVISTAKGMMSKLFSSSDKTKINGFLEKPYNIDELWSKVKDILGE